MVEDKGFREFSKLLDPSYSLPGRKTISTKVLPMMYEKLRTEVMYKIKSATAVCLTTDCWTSITITSYMSVTCHFMEDFKMTSYLLDCFVMTERHTADNLARELTRVSEEWGVKDKIVACVTDNAANIVSACERPSLGPHTLFCPCSEPYCQSCPEDGPKHSAKGQSHC